MSRSRSSFDLSGAIATAATLTTPEEQPLAGIRGMPLVSFGPTSAPPPPSPLPSPPPSPPTQRAEAPKSQPRAAAAPPTAPAPAVSLESSQAELSVPEDPMRRAPRLPDLSSIKSPSLRCEKIVDWIAEAVGATDVFIADASGLPIAGAHADAETRLAAAGVVASSIAHLATAVPGNSSSLFALHVGDGPFFQLIGFDVASSHYVVGLSRSTPLGFRQAHAVRLACRHALSGLAPSEGA